MQGTGVTEKWASPSRVTGGQQPVPGGHPVTSVKGNGSGKGRRKWAIQENKVMMACYFKSVQEKRGYRQKMVMLLEEKGMFKVTEQRLVDQARTILKSSWFTTAELEEIKRPGQLTEDQRVIWNRLNWITTMTRIKFQNWRVS